MDEGLFWGFFVTALILIVLPLFLNGQKWALVSLLGVFLAILVIGGIGTAGMTVGYNGSTAILDTSGLPATSLIFIIIAGFLITIGKGLDKI